MLMKSSLLLQNHPTTYLVICWITVITVCFQMELASWERLLFRPPPLLWSCQHRGQAIKFLVGVRLSLCPWRKHNKQSPTEGLRKQDMPWDVCCLLGSSYQHMEGIRGDQPLFSHRYEQYRLTSTTPTADLEALEGPAAVLGVDCSGGRHAKGHILKD